MTMRAVRVEKYGGEENLKLRDDVPIPTPAADEVLIKVKAAGINPVDTYIRAGMFDNFSVPFTSGCDCAGIVAEVGESVKEFCKGDRVLASLTVTGTYAEYCTVKAIRVCLLQETLTFAQGAAIGIPYYSAHTAIFSKGNATQGDTVLVHGASGAVGIAAVQIAKANGFYVIGTAGTPQGLQLVLDQGADKAYNHREKDYMKQLREALPSGREVNLIIEMLANANLQADMEVAAQRGRIVIIGARGKIEIDPVVVMMKELSIHGTALFNTKDEEWSPMHESMAKGQTNGWLKPRVAKTYTMEEVSQGHHDVIHNSGTLGKLVLEVSS